MSGSSRGDPLRPASPRLRSPRSICDVLPAAAALLSVSGAVDALGVTQSVGEVRRVVVVLVDGMGWHLLPALADDAPLLASVLAGGAGRLDELACTFPSTTPTSLASLCTGVTPGEHGILGFTVKVPETDRVLNHIFWRDDPPAAQWQPVPTWFERVQRAGVDARAVLPAAFLGSGLTEAVYRGAQFHSANRDDDYAQLVADQLRAAPGLLYAYTADLDTAAHLFGVDSPEVRGRDDAVAAGLFGSVRPDHLARIGDVVVTCTGDAAVLATGHEPPEVAHLVGFHGAATPVEMAIPLITFRG